MESLRLGLCDFRLGFECDSCEDLGILICKTLNTSKFDIRWTCALYLTYDGYIASVLNYSCCYGW